MPLGVHITMYWDQGSPVAKQICHEILGHAAGETQS